MKNKRLKILAFSVVFVLSFILFLNFSNAAQKLEKLEYSDEFINWMNLSDEEKTNVIMPNRMFKLDEVNNNYIDVYKMNNVFKAAKVIKASFTPNYDLRTIIPENMKIKDQGNTSLCWAFSALANLESTLALKDKLNSLTAREYDFSEKHMGYATSREAFLNDAINKKGFDKNADDAGNYYLATAYFTNGMGAVNEGSMPFDENFEKISLSSIENKVPVTTIIDAKFFDYKDTEECKTELTRQIKEHIMTKGAVSAQIYGASLSDTQCYNNETGALYADNSSLYGANHGVIIVGWDDYYSKNNFKENKRPNNNGAWIIKNSWGDSIETNISVSQSIERLQQSFDNNPSAFRNTYPEITSKDQITEQFVLNLYRTQYEDTYGRNKIIIKNDKIAIEIGDKGFMYVSYEDANILTNVYGIENALNTKDYEYVYQNEYLGVNQVLGGRIDSANNKIYLASVFDVKQGEDEISKVAINTIYPMNNCKVYINPNGTDKNQSSLQKIDLQEGEYENIIDGYHTIEFANPVKIMGNSFVVVIEMDVENVGQNTYFPVEIEMSTLWTDLDIKTGKCFYGIIEHEGQDIVWEDLGTADYKAILPIKAFSKKREEDPITLSKIEIRKVPDKVTYDEEENFDKTGMKVYAIYSDGTESEITNYTITNGNNLVKTQTSVTITYTEGEITKSVTQNIVVNEKQIEEQVKLTKIEIRNRPNKVVYVEEENFDKTGMKVYAVYSNGTEEEITDYVIVNGNSLTEGQVSVIIEYTKDGITKSITQKITVNKKHIEEQENPEESEQKVLERIYVKKSPSKVIYEEEEDFDKTGMKVYAVYSDETEEEIIDYVIIDGNSLIEGQIDVTIKYTKDGVTKITSQTITVNKKQVKESEETQEKLPTPSDFTNTKSNITKAESYMYTDKNKKEFVALNIKISNIKLGDEDSIRKYYYYLSDKKGINQNDIENWVEFTLSENGTAVIKIDSRNIKNIQNISEKENLYIYIKEVSTLNNKSTTVVNMIGVKNDAKLQTYLDDKRVEESTNTKKENNNGKINSNNGKDVDTTTAKSSIPKAGMTGGIVIIFAISVIGVVAFIRYKNIDK